MEKILIFKVWAIWDILMTTPFLLQLKNSWKYQVDYLCWKSAWTILKWNNCIDNLIIFDEKFFKKINIKNLFSYLRFLLFLWKLYIKNKYEYVIILDKHIIFNFSFRISWFRNRFWFNRLWREWKFLSKTIYWDKSKREVEYYLDFLSLLWLEPKLKKQKYHFFSDIILKNQKWIKLSSEENKLLLEYIPKKNDIDKLVENIRKNWNKIIGIATGGWNLLMPKNDCRRWNLKNWDALANCLLKKWYNVVLLWSKNDRKLELNNSKFYNLLWNYSIHESIYFISKIDLVISQEAWFIHFVWCTDTDLITIAWPTNPYRFHPYDDNWNPQSIWWIRKEKIEKYDEYWSYDKCNGNEINKVEVDDVIRVINF